MKSIKIENHGHSGTGSGTKKLAGFPRYVLVLAEVSHDSTYSQQSLQYVGHQNERVKASNVF